MELYFAPLACSLATRISLAEAGAAADFIEVDLRKKRTLQGADFLTINPLGQVPVLRTAAGELVTENGAVLQYVADQHAASGLAPVAGTMDRVWLQQWLSFIGTELHKGIFAPLIDPTSSDGARAHARTKVASRLAHLEAHLAGREFLLERFTVADAYLTTTLLWTRVTGIDLAAYPALLAYHRRMLERPSVQQAIAIERPLYAAEQARRSA